MSNDTNKQGENFERCFRCKFPILGGSFVLRTDGSFAHNECHLRSTIADLKAEVVELSEPYIDHDGVVWNPPTAWAYAQVCKTLNDVRYADVSELVNKAANDLTTQVREQGRVDVLNDLIKQVRKIS